MENTKYQMRKTIRLKGYSYSDDGAYFVTICVKNKAQLLGEVVGDGACDVPHIILTEYGKVAEKYINLMNQKYDNFYIDKYIIMPNHIHLIIVIQNCNAECGSSQAPNPTNATIPRFVSLYKRYCNREYGKNIWQRSYNDHIIRGKKDYFEIWNYIEYNHLKWSADCFYTE